MASGPDLVDDGPGPVLVELAGPPWVSEDVEDAEGPPDDMLSGESKSQDCEKAVKEDPWKKDE